METIKPSVLVVDDEPKLLESLSLLLKKDFHVLTASHGMEGLQNFQSNRPSLILLDLDMPVINGVEMISKVRKICKETKIIVITGKSCHDWAMRCANLNVQGYMEKPFSPEKLISKIKELLCMEEFNVLRDLWGDDYEERMTSVSSLVRGALDYIECNSHISFTREDISAQLDISPEHLSRKFKEHCCIELREYIIRVRVQKSLKILAKSSNLKIRRVAEAVGMPDVAYFCKIFKKHTGLTPSEFRKVSNTDRPS